MRTPEQTEPLGEDLHYLGALDPAEYPSGLGRGKQEIFARIIGELNRSDLGQSRSSVSHSFRWLAVAAIAALLVAILLIVPFGDDDRRSAFATWTAVPGAVSTEMNHVLDSFCDVSRPHVEETSSTGDCEIVAKEQRGDLGFVAARTASGLLRTAIFLGEDSFLKSVGRTTVQPETLEPNEIKPAFMSSSTGTRDSKRGEREVLRATTLIGAVGADVIGVEIIGKHELDGIGRSGTFSVRATVENGYFAAWWPTEEGLIGDRDEDLIFNLTLRSGEVLRGVSSTNSTDD